MTQRRSVTHMGSHSVTFYPTQVNAPRLHPSQTGRYSIYRPFKGGGLSKPRPMVQRATSPLLLRDSPQPARPEPQRSLIQHADQQAIASHVNLHGLYSSGTTLRCPLEHSSIPNQKEACTRQRNTSIKYIIIIVHKSKLLLNVQCNAEYRRQKMESIDGASSLRVYHGYQVAPTRKRTTTR